MSGSQTLDYLNEKIDSAADILREAKFTFALTGAGISTASGIPDFRSTNNGLWTQFDPMEVASIAGFRHNPHAFYNWLRPLAHKIAAAEPNAAHYALAQMEAAGYLQAVITQNIDLLHSHAGSQQVFEVHGHIRQATCIQCFQEYDAAPLLERFITLGEVPTCTACGNVLKPNAILFGEDLPMQVVDGVQNAMRACDAMLVAGSSLEVYPVADLPRQARRKNARVIIVNREATYMDAEATVVIRAELVEVLPAIAARVLHE